MARLDPHSYFDGKHPRTQHLRLKLNLDFERKRLSGEVCLRFDGEVRGTVDLDSRGLTLNGVAAASGRDIPWQLGDDDPILGRRLRLEIPEATREVTLRYETSPDAIALQWLAPGHTAGRRHPFLFSQCQPHHARSMAPLQDTPLARVTYEAEVTVPEPLTAVMSAGLEGSRPGPEPGTRTFLFKMPQAIPPYLLALAAGNLVSREVGPISRTWSEPELADAAAYEFAEIQSMIAKAEEIFGPYDWDRYDVLILPPSFPFGGMENPRLTFLTPTLLAGDRSLVDTVAHELAHSWTGNLVSNATMNDFWLNEGFTVWAERRILEALYGHDRASLAWAIGQNALGEALERFGMRSPLTRLRTDLWGLDPDETFSEIPYEKGARFVVLLERAVGRQKFDAFVRAYMERFRFTSITTDEFMAFLDQELPGAQGRVNAAAWLYQPGIPPNTPAFPSDRVQAIQTLCSGWADGRRPTPAEVSSLSPAETLVYLQGLPRPMPGGDCAWLDEALRLTGRGNYEILVEWLTIAAASGYRPAFPRIREVLLGVGRMKYLRPLYTAMGSHPETRQAAREAYAAAKDCYHGLTRRLVGEILAGYRAD
jgi:leukotriene-A4 hydrolase